MKKLYYSIGEVSDITEVEAHVLRYWETVFDELNPQKNKAGNRTYKEEDIETILRLKELIQDKKYSTEGAQQVLAQGDEQENETVPISVKKDLKEIRVFLNNLLEKL
ncbi:DNA-binding transcriptional regulator, MerR family [Fodinibius salinus]|uniref:DNA-binding transcriptional regulator, MerR family n=1 Tax=Fodinibius salinus TaxID=860790 RepID=A0A5D3YP66_9BACT|nr:MerR family transcriptional regulator [Fodinibius salinus]TYP95607.1 DNA-binding transcriptional regulator, MerR family [Fodinibius salinus]